MSIRHEGEFDGSEPERQRRAKRCPSLALRLGQCDYLKLAVYCYSVGINSVAKSIPIAPPRSSRPLMAGRLK